MQVEGQRASALRFAEPAVQALLSALVVFRLLPRGFSSSDLRDQWAPLSGKAPADITPGQMTYHLRRLRLHGLISAFPSAIVTALPTAAGAQPCSVRARIIGCCDPVWHKSFPTRQATMPRCVAVLINSTLSSINGLRRKICPFEI